MDQVAALLGSRYGLAVERLEPAPRGWTGETYAATVRDGARFFVKVFPKDRLPRTAAAALPVLAELHRLGLTQVSRPISATSGALHERLGDDLVVVFEYLDAVPVAFTFGGERLGGLIARLHQQTERVASPLARETFEALYADELVLTHGDWPFNLLQSADGTIYLVEWDELLLAPAERDIWFARDDPAFSRGYRARRGGHAENELATAFCVHHR